MAKDKEKKKEEEPKLPILANGRGLALRSMEDMWRFAKAVQESGLAPSSFQRPEQILIAIQTGAELGMPPMRSLQSFCVINGQARLWGDASLALVRQSGLMEYIKEWLEGNKDNDGKIILDDETIAYCETKRKGDPEPKITYFSVEDAKQAGLWGKKSSSGKPMPWSQYPKRMLQLRARSFNLRDNFPDAFGGASIAEDFMGAEIPEPSHEADTPKRAERKVVANEADVNQDTNELINRAVAETYDKFVTVTGTDDVEKFCEYAAEVCEIEGENPFWKFDDEMNKGFNTEAFNEEILQKINDALDGFEKADSSPVQEAEAPGKPDTPPYACTRCGETYKEKPKDMKCKCLGKVVKISGEKIIKDDYESAGTTK